MLSEIGRFSRPFETVKHLSVFIFSMLPSQRCLFSQLHRLLLSQLRTGVQQSSSASAACDSDLFDTEPVRKLDTDRAGHRRKLFWKPQASAEARLLRVSIIGSPNAGKSVLTNALVGSHVCAVSKKVHTTRRLATGVMVDGNTQVNPILPNIRC